MKTCQRILMLIGVLWAIIPEMMGQSCQFKDEKRIYLWDVTLSMKGYQDKTPNIYDKVVQALKKDINSIIDEQTEVIVLPFQTKVLDRWSVKATREGKRELIANIENFENNEVTNTNITLPMKEVMNTLVDPGKRNVLILLTDGEQNAKGYPLDVLLELIRKWCAFAERNDAHAFYVMLTSFAVNDQLVRVIDETCRINKIITDPNDINLNFVELLPQENLKFNIKDDVGKKIRLKIDCKKKVTIPKDVRLHIYCNNNPHVAIDQVASVINGVLEFEVKLKQAYEDMKNALPQDMNERVIVHIEIEEAAKYPLLQLMRENVGLELINKPEKTLKVYVKD